MDAPSQSGTPVIHLHKGDLPADLTFTDAVAVDSETQGLNLSRDRLCVVQLSAGDGVCHLVQIAAGQTSAPNLQALMEDAAVTKIFHYARFDIAALKRWLNIDCTPVYCTKIASKMVRTYTDGHGLKDVVRELVGVELDKPEGECHGNVADNYIFECKIGHGIFLRPT